MSQPLPSLPPRPVTPLEYSYSYDRRRPGLLTAIGVMSIVVVVLGGLANLVMGLWGMGMFMSARAFATMAARPPRPVMVAPAPAPMNGAAEELEQDDAVPPARGMRAADRRIVIAGLSRVRPLSPAQRKQLNALLAKDGKDVFVLAGEDMTPEVVAANVSSSGKIAASEEPKPDGWYFAVGRGRLEVTADDAAFTPSNGQEFRVSAGISSDTLNAAQLDAIVARIQQLSGNKATAAQVTAIRQQLQTPGQTLISPVQTAGEAVAQVASAVALSDGSLQVMTTNGAWLRMSPQGQVLMSSMAGPSPAMGMFKINTAVCAMAMVEAVLSLGLLVLLLVASILLLRSSKWGRTLHLAYAAIKLPLALASGVIWGWLVYEFVGNVMTMAGTATNTSPATVVGVILAVVGGAYPIALLIALRSRSVREYFNSAA